jgi:hypothetical protein
MIPRCIFPSNPDDCYPITFQQHEEARGEQDHEPEQGVCGEVDKVTGVHASE